MSKSIYLRLAGPLQSWAGSTVTGNFVRTERIPTRSGLEGLIAGALGARRGQWPEWLSTLDFSIRVDADGALTDDFQTINRRDSEEDFRSRLFIMLGQSASKARGNGLVYTPDAQHGTSITKRTYLADAEFIVRITSEEHGEEIAEALRKPVFSTYLGRKAFVAEFPFFLGVGPAAVWESLPIVVRADRDEGVVAHSGEERVARPTADVDRGTIDATAVPRVPLHVVEYSPGLPARHLRQQFPQVSSREEWLQYVGETLERSIAVL
ncbi:type I-E CRISPR-associated protein Cas5/CasD [Neoactinobaculum massilliense]|uniref:type I-E CRISPR-associated protein Cas5/CasD n=1 Tax=Neoactinobaculum massilliense TaxID=2364794 RepID=UPI000F51F771|nr:type I-E CRISPR-associated protein Cas5/CasD [Neoactinobaculum massilliense]